MKGNVEKERYTHQNAELQRVASWEKKAFFSEQWREIEENNRMGKTRDLFKKIRDTKGIFHANKGTIKNRNNMDLTEAEYVKKKGEEYTVELYKNYSNDPDNLDDTIRHTGVWSQVGYHYEQR